MGQHARASGGDSAGDGSHGLRELSPAGCHGLATATEAEGSGEAFFAFALHSATRSEGRARHTSRHLRPRLCPVTNIHQYVSVPTPQSVSTTVDTLWAADGVNFMKIPWMTFLTDWAIYARS